MQGWPGRQVTRHRKWQWAPLRGERMAIPAEGEGEGRGGPAGVGVGVRSHLHHSTVSTELP